MNRSGKNCLQVAFGKKEGIIMAWEHFDVFDSGKCVVRDMNSGQEQEWEYLFGYVTTGKQRVFMNYRLIVQEKDNGRCFVGNYRHHLWGTLCDIHAKMLEHGLDLHVAGTSERYYETGLSHNSGWGYLRGTDIAIRMMDSYY